MTALAVTCCALAIAACGSSSKPTTTTGLSPFAVALKFSECMRAHGVPNFPDPLSGGGFTVPSTVNPQSPAFIAADKECGRRKS